MLRDRQLEEYVASELVSGERGGTINIALLTELGTPRPLREGPQPRLPTLTGIVKR
jgi:hypothetical protein